MGISSIILAVVLGLVAFATCQDTSGCFKKLKNPEQTTTSCGSSGKLSKPKVELALGAIKFDDCIGRCGNLGFRCKSLSYNKVDPDCTLYKQTLEDQGFTPSSGPPKNLRYYNKNCFNITCGPYCDFAPVREGPPAGPTEVVVDGNFESVTSAWTGNNGATLSNECNGGFFPYDGIRFANLPRTGSNSPFLIQKSNYKLNTSYTLTYRYRVEDYTSGSPSFVCNISPTFTTEVFGAVSVNKTIDEYQVVKVPVRLTKSAASKTFGFFLTCGIGVQAIISIDSVSLVVPK